MLVVVSKTDIKYIEFISKYNIGDLIPKIYVNSVVRSEFPLFINGIQNVTKQLNESISISRINRKTDININQRKKILSSKIADLKTRTDSFRDMNMYCIDKLKNYDSEKSGLLNKKKQLINSQKINSDMLNTLKAKKSDLDIKLFAYEFYQDNPLIREQERERYFSLVNEIKDKYNGDIVQANLNLDKQIKEIEERINNTIKNRINDVENKIAQIDKLKKDCDEISEIYKGLLVDLDKNIKELKDLDLKQLSEDIVII